MDYQTQTRMYNTRSRIVGLDGRSLIWKFDVVTVNDDLRFLNFFMW